MLKRRIVLDDEELAASIPDMPPEPPSPFLPFRNKSVNLSETPLPGGGYLMQPVNSPAKPYGGYVENVAVQVVRWPNARKVTAPPGPAGHEQVWALCQASAEKAQAYKQMRCVICKTPNNFDANLDTSIVKCKTCGDEQTITELLHRYEDL